METVRLILLIAHILGFAALIGGLLAQAGPGDKKVTGTGLVLLVLVMANLRKEKIPNGLWAGLLVLSVAEVCVAVLWSSAHSVS